MIPSLSHMYSSQASTAWHINRFWKVIHMLLMKPDSLVFPTKMSLFVSPATHILCTFSNPHHHKDRRGIGLAPTWEMRLGLQVSPSSTTFLPLSGGPTTSAEWIVVPDLVSTDPPSLRILYCRPGGSPKAVHFSTSMCPAWSSSNNTYLQQAWMLQEVLASWKQRVATALQGFQTACLRA